MLDKVTERFDNRLRTIVKNQNVLNYLINHSARKNAIENLKREITIAYGVLDRMGTLDKRQRSINAMIDSVADMYSTIAIHLKEKEINLKEGDKNGTTNIVH